MYIWFIPILNVLPKSAYDVGGDGMGQYTGANVIGQHAHGCPGRNSKLSGRNPKLPEGNPKLPEWIQSDLDSSH